MIEAQRRASLAPRSRFILIDGYADLAQIDSKMGDADMKSWLLERDRVVKQTLSFVEAAAAAMPSRAKPVTEIAQPTALAEPAALLQPPAIAQPAAAAQPAAIAQPITPAPEAVEHITPKPRPIAESAAPKVDSAVAVARPKLSERAEILMRVNAFKDHQIKVRREREEYYEATLAKTRAALSSSMTLRNPG